MRQIVPTPPTTRCPHCKGELRLKQVDHQPEHWETREVMVCAKCGRQTVFVMDDGKRPYLGPGTRQSNGR